MPVLVDIKLLTFSRNLGHFLALLLIVCLLQWFIYNKMPTITCLDLPGTSGRLPLALAKMLQAAGM